MRLYEVARLPVKIGIQPLKWFGSLVVDRATEAARANVIEIWRKPWEKEVQEHFTDAKQQGDFSRADEQRSLQWCIERYAPQTAGEFEELASEARQNPSDGEVDVLFDPRANQPPADTTHE